MIANCSAPDVSSRTGRWTTEARYCTSSTCTLPGTFEFLTPWFFLPRPLTQLFKNRLCANARVQAKHTLVQTQSAQKVLRERCVTRHVEVAHGGPASPVVPSHVGRTRRARGERDRLGQACARVLILSGSYPSAKWGLLETTGFHHSPQHSPGGGGATLSLSIAKEPKLPREGPGAHARCRGAEGETQNPASFRRQLPFLFWRIRLPCIPASTPRLNVA